MAKRNFCVVIPAYNEERVIASSLKSLKRIITRENIFVVSDGSADATVKIARLEGVNVMALRKNGGKGTAQDKVIRSRRLTKRFRYILFSDADSRLDVNFLIEIKKLLKQNPALIVGTVTSDRRGLISAFRTFEYSLSHRVYKSAQNIIKVITVAPGCASLYRSDALEQLQLKSPTLTEDFDLTIQIHRKKLGQIIYASKARVITQDPMTLADYWKQVVRWNTGTWQNILLYRLYRPDAKLNLELWFLLTDNVLWLASLAFAILYPWLFLTLFGTMFATNVLLAVIIAFLEKKYWIIPYAPLFPLFNLLNIAAYYYSIFRAAGKGRSLAWHKVKRYSV